MSFNVGDRVRCIDNHHYQNRLGIGEIYVVTSVREPNQNGVVLLQVQGFGNSGFKESRFELVQENEPAEAEPEQQSHSFYLILYKRSQDGEIVEVIRKDEDRANHFVRMLIQEDGYVLVAKKKITIKY